MELTPEDSLRLNVLLANQPVGWTDGRKSNIVVFYLSMLEFATKTDGLKVILVLKCWTSCRQSNLRA